jgi:hypothetical protein
MVNEVKRIEEKTMMTMKPGSVQAGAEQGH